MKDEERSMHAAAWQIYNRAPKPTPWQDDSNLPWNEPDFSRRMLVEHLDDSHGAASRQTHERQLQIKWLWSKLNLQPGSRILDVTCGPGLYSVELARLGCSVTGIDFSPASIDYAQQLADENRVAERCSFFLADIRGLDFTKYAPAGGFDAALFLYGQLGVFPKQTASKLLNEIFKSLRPGGLLCIELLDQDKVDKEDSSWWFTDNRGLWGSDPFLHLGERFWLAEEAISIERFRTITLQSGESKEIVLCDQTYAQSEMVNMLEDAGSRNIETFPSSAGISLYDAEEWVIYLAET